MATVNVLMVMNAQLKVIIKPLLCRKKAIFNKISGVGSIVYIMLSIILNRGNSCFQYFMNLILFS